MSHTATTDHPAPVTGSPDGLVSLADMTPLPGPTHSTNFDVALQAIVTWSTSSGLRTRIIRDSQFPLPDDMSAFLLVNQLIYRGAARPTDLADAIDTGKSNVAKIVRRLENQGLVARARDPRDDRSIVIGLSAEGRQVGHRILSALNTAYVPTTEALTPEEAQMLGMLLHKLARSIDALPGHPLSTTSGVHFPAETS